MPPPDEPRQDEAGPATMSPAPAPRPAPVPARPAGPVSQQRSVAALFVALLSLAGMLALGNLTRGVYVAMFAMLAGLVALWLGVSSLVRARRERTLRPRGSVTALAIAATGILLSGVMLITFAVFGKQLATYSRCMSGALTISAQQACQTQFSRSMSHQLAVLRSAGNP